MPLHGKLNPPPLEALESKGSSRPWPIQSHYNRNGWHGRHVPHGWRAAFSTVMNERQPAERYVIDAMLAHVPKDKVEAAYNRSEHMERRRKIAEEWAELLMEGMAPAGYLLGVARRG